MTDESEPRESTTDDLIAGAWRQVADDSVERAGAAAGEAAGDVIDRYKLLQEIGEGGMGTVWMAEQSEPIKRRVALKIIKLGMDTKEVVVRFEAERQALALMDHPNIAHVIDGGATETGRPYFVMELVKGVPITEYCDRAKAGLRERLELFTKVCEAIQHAHHKGVIHRDIKPSNVLVTLHDGVPVPKVIDFGIAKATSAELTQKTMFTQFAAIIGTPEYMAPEQAEMSGLDIDTRADVYSLGVLLYELLTGTKPFDMKTALAAGYQEMLRTIREVDPAKPSTRVSTLRETGTLADGRHVNVDEMSRRLRGDLDWIVMKALEKDRSRRYETPNSFAADLARYLVGDPVEAAPPSTLYRVKKFIRRRRKSVATVAVFLMLLVAGAVGTGIGWWRTERANEALDQALQERTAALDARTEALAGEEEQRELAERNAEEARTELRRAEVTNHLIGDLLRSLTPQVAKGADVTPFRRVLDRAVERLNDGTIEDPLVAAQLRETVGGVFLLLGLYDDALQHLPRAVDELAEILGPDHIKTRAAQLALGRLYLMTDDDEQAERLLRGAFDTFLEEHGGTDDRTLLAAQSLALFYGSRERTEEALEVLSTGPDGGFVDYDYDVQAHRLHAAMLVMALINSNRYAEAQEWLDELSAACADGADCNEEELQSLASTRALLAEKRGDKKSALVASHARYERLLETHGPDHPETLISMTELGVKLVDFREFDAAEELIEDAEDRAEDVLGPDHRATLRARYAMAWLRMHERRRNKAERLYLALLEDADRILPAGNEVSTSTRRDLGMLYQELKRPDDAEKMMRAALDMTLATKPEGHIDVMGARTNLAGLCYDLGHYEEAVAQCEISLPNLRRILGPDHQWTNNATYILANTYTKLGRDDDALPLHRDFLEFEVRQIERAGDAAPAGQMARQGWHYLRYPIEELRDPQRAVEFATRACEAAERQEDRARFEYLDLLSQAKFELGDVEGAVAAIEESAAGMPPQVPKWLRDEIEGRVEEYRAALGE